VYLLEEKTHETVLEINLNAISYNLNFFKSNWPNVKIMVMVKAFGYGNGGWRLLNYLNTTKWITWEWLSEERRYSIANYGS
jgi:alanine racemase